MRTVPAVGAAVLLVSLATNVNAQQDTCKACEVCSFDPELRVLIEGVGEWMFRTGPLPLGCPIEINACHDFENIYPPCEDNLNDARQTLTAIRAGRSEAAVRFAAAHSAHVRLLPERGVLVVSTACSGGVPVFALPVNEASRVRIAEILHANRVTARIGVAMYGGTDTAGAARGKTL
jgi:hypothetical protein